MPHASHAKSFVCISSTVHKKHMTFPRVHVSARPLILMLSTQSRQYYTKRHYLLVTTTLCSVIPQRPSLTFTATDVKSHTFLPCAPPPPSPGNPTQFSEPSQQCSMPQGNTASTSRKQHKNILIAQSSSASIQ